MIADIESDIKKNLSAILTELFFRGRNLNLFVVFIKIIPYKKYTKEPDSFSVNHTTNFFIK